MRALIAAVLLTLLSSRAMAAGSPGGLAMGGPNYRVLPVIAQYDQSGELFRIDGYCRSSCTLLLSIRNVCIGRGATLLFHAADDGHGMISPSYTAVALDHYNPRLRDYVTAHHYMDTFEFHAISGRDMIAKFGYRECPRK